MQVIKYIAALNKITGNIFASLLLAQVLYWYDKMKRYFFKYNKPNSSKLYKEGDSWVEELGMTENEFLKARKAIGSKINFKKPIDLQSLNLLLYWRDSNNQIYYCPNFVKMLEVDPDGLIFPRLSKEFAILRSQVVKHKIPYSEIKFRPFGKCVFEVSIIQENTTGDYSEDYTGNYSKKDSYDFLLKNKSNEFREVWKLWWKHRATVLDKKDSITYKNNILDIVCEHEEAFVIQIIRKAMLSGWSSFYFEDTPEAYQEYLKNKNGKNEQNQSKNGKEFPPHIAAIFNKYRGE